MYDNYKKGQLACLKVQERALEKGVLVSIPTVEARYDLVLDYNGQLSRVQVKYVSKKTPYGSYEVDLRKETRNNGIKRTYSADEVDVVIAYIAELESVCWFGPDVFSGKKSLCIRESPPKTGTKGIRLIVDYKW